MVDANFFCYQKKRKVKLDKVREGPRPITFRFRAYVRKLILGSIGTPLDHLSVNVWAHYDVIMWHALEIWEMVILCIKYRRQKLIFSLKNSKNVRFSFFFFLLNMLEN